MKAQLASKSQLLSIMSKKQHELEGRLDDMLSRIAKETQEIKDLEQQLTEGERHCSDIGMIISKMLCLLLLSRCCECHSKRVPQPLKSNDIALMY